MPFPIYSMTGFAKAEGEVSGRKLTLELRSVNNRFLEFQFRLPRSFSMMEIEMKNLIKSELGRGTVNCSLNMEDGEKSTIPLDFNEEILSRYMGIVEKMKEKFPQLEGTPDWQTLLSQNDMITYGESFEVDEEFQKGVLGLLKDALTKMKEMRGVEGENLKVDLQKRVAFIESTLDKVEVELPKRIEDVRNKTHERVTKLMQDVKSDSELDEVRLIQEVSVLADRLDVSEEIIRFRSHNKLFLQTLDEKGPHGKKLNFILQEMAREANTLGTKSQQAKMAHLAVSIKEEVEAMREQVMNLE